MTRETYLYGRGGGSGVYFLLFFCVVIVGGVLVAGMGATGIPVAGGRITPATVTLFYFAVAGFVGWLAWREVQSERFKTASQRPIELDAHEIVAPATPNRRRMVRLTYSGITELKVDSDGGESWLHIKHDKGRLAISSEAMESYTAFQRMLTSLELRVSLARAPRKAG